jgi:hypothetical protein
VALNAFDDPSHQPTPKELRAILGGASRFWSALVADVRRGCKGMTEHWNFGAKFGWSLRLKHEDRILVYLTPRTGRMLVGVVLGEKAVNAARAAGKTSDATLALVAAAPKYAEGRGVRVEVGTDDELRVARELARIKIGV